MRSPLGTKSLSVCSSLLFLLYLLSGCGDGDSRSKGSSAELDATNQLDAESMEDGNVTGDTSSSEDTEDSSDTPGVPTKPRVIYEVPDLTGDRTDSVISMPGKVGVQPAVAVSTTGTPVVVFTATPGEEGDLAIHLSIQGRPTVPLRTEPAGQRNEPSLCRLADDNFVAVWSYDGQAIGNPLGVEGAVFTADGAVIAEFDVKTEVEGNHWLGHVGCNPAGGFTVVGSRTDTDNTTFGVFAQHYGNDGAPLSPAFQINPTPDGTQVQPVVGIGPGGEGVVIYEDSPVEGDYILTARPINMDGPNGSSFTLLASEGVDCLKPAIAVAPSGRIAYAGNMGAQIHLFKVASAAAPEPSDAWFKTFGSYVFPAVTFLSDENALAMASLLNVTGAGEPSVRVEILEGDSESSSTSVLLGDDPKLPPYPPSIGYGAGTLAVAWTQRTEEGFQVYLSTFKSQPVQPETPE